MHVVGWKLYWGEVVRINVKDAPFQAFSEQQQDVYY